LIFFDQKLQFTYPEASIKDVKATGEAFSPTLNNLIFLTFFLFLRVFFALLDPIRNTGSGCAKCTPHPFSQRWTLRAPGSLFEAMLLLSVHGLMRPAQCSILTIVFCDPLFKMSCLWLLFECPLLFLKPFCHFRWCLSTTRQGINQCRSIRSVMFTDYKHHVSISK
jgi:hypothetical protein